MPLPSVANHSLPLCSVMSKKVSPHVTNVVEVDVTKLVRWREKNKDAFFRREGVKLTYMPVITEAVTSLTGEEATGAAIVFRAIEAPIKQIAENAGVSGDVVINTVRSLPDGEGFNAATDTYEDLLAAGVTDPVKVTRSALQNAASIAGLFLTTEAVVANKPEPKSAAPAAGADMGY